MPSNDSSKSDSDWINCPLLLLPSSADAEFSH